MHEQIESSRVYAGSQTGQTDSTIDLYAGINAGMQSILFDEDGFYPDYPGVTRFESYAQMLEALKNGQI